MPSIFDCFSAPPNCNLSIFSGVNRTNADHFLDLMKTVRNSGSAERTMSGFMSRTTFSYPSMSTTRSLIIGKLGIGSRTMLFSSASQQDSIGVSFTFNPQVPHFLTPQNHLYARSTDLSSYL